MAAYHWVYDLACVCVTVGLVGGGGSPPPAHDYACWHLEANCRVRDQLHSPRNDPRVCDLPLPLPFTFKMWNSYGSQKAGLLGTLSVLWTAAG